MAGYECEFVEPPAKYLKVECPICLYILREQPLAVGKTSAKDALKGLRQAKVLARVANRSSLPTLRISV